MLPSIFRRYFAYTGELKCRHCGSTSVRLSKSLNKRSPFHIYRCSVCGRHFKAGLKQDRIVGYVLSILIALMFLIMLASFVYHGLADDEAPESELTLEGIEAAAKLP
jgi:hypothetical protein